MIILAQSLSPNVVTMFWEVGGYYPYSFYDTKLSPEAFLGLQVYIFSELLLPPHWIPQTPLIEILATGVGQ